MQKEREQASLFPLKRFDFCENYLLKYRFSIPSRALPWRASSRAICLADGQAASRPMGKRRKFNAFPSRSTPNDSKVKSKRF